MIKELIDSARDYYEDNPQKFVEFLYDAYSSTKIQSYRDALYEACEENNLCTECLIELDIIEYSEYRGEYFGFPCEEVMCRKICKECGREYD